MSEPVRIKITPNDKMVEIPINQYKEYKSRVMLEIMFDVYTSGRTEEEAGADSENIVEWVTRKFSEYLEANADGVELPSPSECWMSNWGVRNLDIEEYKEDDGDGEV